MPAVRSIISEGLFHGQTFDESDTHIICPWHGYSFHLADGSNVCDPKLRLEKYEVVERDGAVYVAV
jgi:nitrite reductase/ring-hydroxylating ferredoxin subunit